ncbi:hypothetical protein GUJ93_ZPchr0015g6670 [Zizania palustris]|uniref:Protein CMSS1 n=1 Tax=Zizania palustris TaxID=103762 RepID=A0A8J5TB16_ZIZPA|nr:hypothetical protein GUJ93_ZPchr0015g6670 [Zizania palustris]
MAPAEARPPTAAGRNSKKPHRPTKSLTKKPTNPFSARTKKKLKQKKNPPSTTLANPEQSTATAAEDEPAGASGVILSAAMTPARQLEFFLRSFERAAKMRLSPLELDAFSERCMVPLEEGLSQDVESFSDHVKGVFGGLWKEELCEGKLEEGSVDAGSPALLVISSAALRSLELLRGLKMLTKECRPVKLFAKHMKVEEQVQLLKTRVNIACGTPNSWTAGAGGWSGVVGVVGVLDSGSEDRRASPPSPSARLRETDREGRRDGPAERRACGGTAGGDWRRGGESRATRDRELGHSRTVADDARLYSKGPSLLCF